MSPLHCAATLLLARHAEAEQAGEPAADGGGSLTATGHRQARALGKELAGRRVAWVYASPLAPALQTAEIAAAVLGVQVTVCSGLRELAAGEGGAEVLARMSAELGGIADAHPGETVLVVSHGDVLGYAVPRLALNLPAGYAQARPLAYAGLVEAATDSDGMVVRGWAGRSLTVS